MLTAEMKSLITNYRAGMVATVDDDGTPAVSPKATFVILDDRTLAFGNIRSPGTLANLNKRPAVEVVFLDVLNRCAVRAKGTASIIAKERAEAALRDRFEAEWGEYVPRMSAFVVIAIERAAFVTSPAYDVGHTAAELRATNIDRLKQLA